MDAMNLPPGDADVDEALRRREAPRRALQDAAARSPTCCCSTNRRTISTPRASPGSNGILKDYEGTVVAVTHDRYFLDNVAQWILELDCGRGIPFEGNYTSWLEQKKRRLEVEEKQASARQKTLARELEWVRMSAKARQAKSKARLKAYETMAAEQFEDRADELEIQIPPGPRLGDLVVEADEPRQSRTAIA